MLSEAVEILHRWLPRWRPGYQSILSKQLQTVDIDPLFSTFIKYLDNDKFIDKGRGNMNSITSGVMCYYASIMIFYCNSYDDDIKNNTKQFNCYDLPNNFEPIIDDLKNKISGIEEIHDSEHNTNQFKLKDIYIFTSLYMLMDYYLDDPKVPLCDKISLIKQLDDVLNKDELDNIVDCCEPPKGGSCNTGALKGPSVNTEIIMSNTDNSLRSQLHKVKGESKTQVWDLHSASTLQSTIIFRYQSLISHGTKDERRRKIEALKDIYYLEIKSSQVQKNTNLDRDLYLDICENKGGATVQAIEAILGLPVSHDGYQLGACIQLLDDLYDVQKDINDKIITVATHDLDKYGNLDELFCYTIIKIDNLDKRYLIFKIGLLEMLIALIATMSENFSDQLIDMIDPDIIPVTSDFILGPSVYDRLSKSFKV